MALLELMLVFWLQFEGLSGKEVFLYYRAGDEATFSCDRSLSVNSCDYVNWLYYKDSSLNMNKVRNGNVVKGSAHDARLSLSADCSLVINNITAEDVGLYFCRYGEITDRDINSYLTILTVSSVQPKQDGEVTLVCSLLRYPDLPWSCGLNSIRWVDDTGRMLLGEGDGYRFDGQTKCLSYLTLNHRSGHNRRYTCQFVQDGIMKIDAHYTPVFSGVTGSNGPTSDHQTIIIVGAVVGGLVGLLIIAAVLIRCRRRAKRTDDAEKPTLRLDEVDTNVTYATVNHPNPKPSPKLKDEADTNVTYATVNHANQKTSPKRKVRQDVEEMVTYSTLKAQT